MSRFKVWSGELHERHDADEVDATDSEYAAEEWCERHFADLDYETHIDQVMVEDDQGVVTEWGVSVESVPHFHATKKVTK